MNRKKGASNAFKGISKGTSASYDKNGISGSFKTKEVSGPKDDPTVKSKTIASSNGINQHKRLAMTGGT